MSDDDRTVAMGGQRMPCRGDEYQSMGCVCRVKRVSLKPSVKFPHGWADLWVYQLSSGAGWMKRQPLPLAESFTFIRYVGENTDPDIEAE